MKIAKTTTPIAFGKLDVGEVFTPVDSDIFYMTCCDVKDIQYPDVEETLNAVIIGNDCDVGVLMHFDVDDMVVPYYNCTLKVS